MLDTTDLKSRINLAALVESDLGPASKKNGRWLLWLCPFHADKDPSLSVTEDNGAWHCFGCGESGDAISWIQKREGLSFKEACQRLGGLPSLPAPTVRKAAAISDDGGPPSIDWQEKAQAIVDEAAEALWTDAGSSARDYLHRRGLTDDTLRRWQIGYNHATRRMHGLEVEHGILIPCYYDGALWEVKVRRPKGKPKYKAIAGSKTALFGAETLSDHQIAVLAEGQFDAILLDQVAGHLVGVATSTAPMSNWRSSWTHHFLHCRRVLIAYDTDPPGESRAKKLLAMFARARRMTPPIRPPEGKDITDYHLQGGNLRAWVDFHLGRREIEALPEQPCEQEATQTPQEPQTTTLRPSGEQELNDIWTRWHGIEEQLREG